ncbi:hypothetical protein PR048_031941, partial [Dryococelus australis]
MLLPKNTTALIQPLHQGIRAFKAHYHRKLLLFLCHISMTLEDLVSWADCDSREPVSETVDEQDIITAVQNN